MNLRDISISQVLVQSGPGVGMQHHVNTKRQLLEMYTL